MVCSQLSGCECIIIIIRYDINFYYFDNNIMYITEFLGGPGMTSAIGDLR